MDADRRLAKLKAHGSKRIEVLNRVGAAQMGNERDIDGRQSRMAHIEVEAHIDK
ncbi:hypothetical protein D3C72_2509110 [compost metagenome]